MVRRAAGKLPGRPSLTPSSGFKASTKFMNASLRLAQDTRRILVDRGLWKQVNYAFATVTYLCSCVFFLLGLGEFSHRGADGTAILDALIAVYFLHQGIFLFILAWVVERRRESRAVDFPNRRNNR